VEGRGLQCILVECGAVALTLSEGGT
jgi:hypothetical protein